MFYFALLLLQWAFFVVDVMGISRPVVWNKPRELRRYFDWQSDVETAFGPWYPDYRMSRSSDPYRRSIAPDVFLIGFFSPVIIWKWHQTTHDSSIFDLPGKNRRVVLAESQTRFAFETARIRSNALINSTRSQGFEPCCHPTRGDHQGHFSGAERDGDRWADRLRATAGDSHSIRLDTHDTHGLPVAGQHGRHRNMAGNYRIHLSQY